VTEAATVGEHEQVVTAIRPVSACSPEQLAELFAAGGWPAFIGADAAAARALPRVRETFGAHELAVLDGPLRRPGNLR
jgi:hypothetical protein